MLGGLEPCVFAYAILRNFLLTPIAAFRVWTLLWVEKITVCLSVSKAFTRESDDARADEMPSLRLRPSGVRNYITREGADRLRRRLMDLREERRILADHLENSNTPSARKRLELECQKLESILDLAIIAETPSDQEKVALGAWVRLRDEVGTEETYQIVGPDEAEPAEGRISSASPLARVLLTRRAGEKVHFQIPAGQRELTILSVHYGAPAGPEKR
jgi:transcription elongation factor GreB